MPRCFGRAAGTSDDVYSSDNAQFFGGDGGVEGLIEHAHLARQVELGDVLYEPTHLRRCGRAPEQWQWMRARRESHWTSADTSNGWVGENGHAPLAALAAGGVLECALQVR